MSRFLETIDKHIVIADGGMGSMVHQAIQGPIPCVDELNLTHADTILAIHLRYLRAGARLIETNTFGANRAKLEIFGLADQTAAINSRAVKLAREARDIAGTDAFVAGSIGPAGLEWDETDEAAAAAREIFREQATVLDDRGVDLFVLETFYSVWEIERAVEAVREVSALPVVAQITFPAADEWAEPGAVLPGDAARRFERLRATGAAVVGTNCSLGPGEMLSALELLARGVKGHHLAVQPNSGLPRLASGRFIFPQSSPEYFAWFAREAARLGARLIGGCCGTTPEHVAAMAGAVRDLTPQKASVSMVVAPPPAESVAGQVPAAGTGRLAGLLAAKEFVVSVQVDPPKGTHAGMILEACRLFRESGLVHTADVNSNPMARLHMDALWMSLMIQSLGEDRAPAGKLGDASAGRLEAIPHYTPRDASLMGIEGNLLGAWALGLRNVLVITGDPSMVGGEPGDHDVYQTDSIGMVRHIAQLNRGIDCYGNKVGSPPNYTIGVAVNPAHEDIEFEVDRFRQKVDAGAQFAMTQVFFDWEPWERFIDCLGGPPPIPVLVAIWPLTSHALAVRLHNEVPGIIVPQHVQDMLEQAGPNARREGFALAREMLAESRRRAQGVYIIAPFKQPKAALELLA